MAYNYGFNQTSVGHSTTYQSNNTYTTTPYGAQGGANGGGFMQNSQDGSQTKKPDYDRDTLRPVTILQIVEAEEVSPGGDIRLDDSELTRISLVGQIRSIARQTTNTTFKLDDGTGTCEAKDWNDIDAGLDEDLNGAAAGGGRKNFEQGQWVKVHGSIKIVNGRRHVSVSVMRRLADLNEINYHLLEATYVHLYLTRGPPQSLQQANGGGSDPYGNGSTRRLGEGGPGPQETGFTDSNPRLVGLTAAARKVMTCMMNTPQTNEGLHAQTIATHTGLSPHEVMRAGEELVSRSMIFSTVDDMTWAPLDE